MKRLLIIPIIALAFLPLKAQAQIALTYSTSTQPQVNSVSQKTAPFTATSSELGVIFVSSAATGRTITVGDSQGNTWTLATTTTVAGGVQPTCAVYYLPNMPGGANYVASTTISGATALNRIFFLSFSGVALTNPLDSIISSTTPSANAKVQTGLLTTQGLTEAFVMQNCGPSSGVTTHTNGFTLAEGGGRGAVGYRIMASTTASGSATFASSETWSSILVSFLPAIAPSFFDLEASLSVNGLLSIQ